MTDVSGIFKRSAALGTLDVIRFLAKSAAAKSEAEKPSDGGDGGDSQVSAEDVDLPDSAHCFFTGEARRRPQTPPHLLGGSRAPPPLPHTHPISFQPLESISIGYLIRALSKSQ